MRLKCLACSWLGGPRYTITTDPAVVEYILKTVGIG